MNFIIKNKRVYFDYSLEDKFVAGLSLEGWEVKTILSGHAQLSDSFVVFKANENGNIEAFVTGLQLSPSSMVSTHKKIDTSSWKKLLLKRSEINKIFGKTREKGFSCVIENVFYDKKSRKLKCSIALAKGKKEHDKRHTLKENDIKRDLQREG
jgi:SsrA-binding protein